MRSGLSDGSLVTDDEKNTNSVCLFLCSAGPSLLAEERRERDKEEGRGNVLIKNYSYQTCAKSSLLRNFIACMGYNNRTLKREKAGEIFCHLSAALGRCRGFGLEKVVVFALDVFLNRRSNRFKKSANDINPIFCTCYSPASCLLSYSPRCYK